MEDLLRLDGTNLRIENLISVLEGKTFKVQVAREKMDLDHGELFELSEDLKYYYKKGIAFNNILKDYSVSFGELLPNEIGILSLYLLLNQSINHYDVLRNEFVERITTFINNGIYPYIHLMNMTEASAMSELALILSGEENFQCHYNGESMPINKVLESLELNKFIFTAEEVAFMTNLCCISTAISIYAVRGAEKLSKTADICVGMNLEAIRGETGAFDRRLHELARPYPNQIHVAENIRRIIEGSELTTERARIEYGGDHGPRCQDAICIRAVPQTHGGVRDTIQWLKESLQNEINLSLYNNNPQIGYAIDFMIIGLIDLGNISERRSFRLTDTNLSYGLPMNLVGENPGFNHGFPVIQASATAVLGELKLLGMPSSSYSKFDPISKEYICTTYNSALKTINAITLLNKVLAIEMLMVAQAMDLVRDRLVDFKFGSGSNVAHLEFRKHVDVTRENRFAAPDMVMADKIVEEGIIVKTVENRIGKLM